MMHLPCIKLQSSYISPTSLRDQCPTFILGCLSPTRSGTTTSTHYQLLVGGTNCNSPKGNSHLGGKLLAAAVSASFRQIWSWSAFLNSLVCVSLSVALALFGLALFCLRPSSRGAEYVSTFESNSFIRSIILPPFPLQPLGNHTGRCCIDPPSSFIVHRAFTSSNLALLHPKIHHPPISTKHQLLR